jgi:ACS family hexuronate transporter-like MFS transporter
MSISGLLSGKRLAWTVTLILFAGSVINYIDRAVLGVVMPQIRKDLSLSNTDYGIAVNTFLLMYMVSYIGGGRIADRIGIRRTFLLTTITWSIASAMHALARGLPGLCFSRALLGLGEGGFYPTAMRSATELFEPRDRAKAVGLLLAGISVGALLTPPLVALTAGIYGWRVTFLLTGLLGLLIVPFWIVAQNRLRHFKSRLPRAEAIAQTTPHDQSDLSVREVLKKRKYWFFLVARALSDIAWYFFIFWLPGYFQAVRHFDLAMIGGFLWIPYFCADVGAFAGAWGSSALIARGLSLNAARRGVLITSAALGALGALTYYASSWALSLAFTSIALFGHFSMASNLHTVITEIVPERHVAVLYGVTGAAGTLLAAISQPLVGRLVDISGYEIPFVVGGVCYLLSILLIIGAGKIERLTRKPSQHDLLITAGTVL